jgi:hypothetical protein
VTICSSACCSISHQPSPGRRLIRKGDAEPATQSRTAASQAILETSHSAKDSTVPSGSAAVSARIVATSGRGRRSSGVFGSRVFAPGCVHDAHKPRVVRRACHRHPPCWWTGAAGAIRGPEEVAPDPLSDVWMRSAHPGLLPSAAESLKRGKKRLPDLLRKPPLTCCFSL